MKILVAIQSSENPVTLSKTTLRWAARAGYNMRIFVPDESQVEQYQEAIADANHNWYLDLPPTVVIGNKAAKEFAKEESFDLIVYLPDNLRKWNPKLTHDKNVIDYAVDLGAARVKFGSDPKKKLEKFINGALMERV